MPTVNADFMQYLFYKFRKMFNDWFLAARLENDYTQFASVIESTTRTESLNFLSVVPKFRLWTDTRSHQAIGKAFQYNISANHYEATVEVDADDVADDQLGLIYERVQQLGQEAGRAPWELFVTALMANGTSYDGHAFFYATHQDEAEGTQTNMVSATGTTLAAVRADFLSARTQMKKLVDSKGRPMNLGMRGLVVLAPPDLQDVFEQVLNSNFYPATATTGVFGAEDNVLKGAATLIIDPYLTASYLSGNSATTWYLFDTSQPTKPMVFINRKAAEFVAQDRPDAEVVFDRRMFRYGVDFRANAGYGLWPLAARVA